MTIYYQPDWLIFGGPPPRSDAPNVEINDTNAGTMLSIVYEEISGMWQIIAGDGQIGAQHVVMESNNNHQILNYFRDYLANHDEYLIQERIAEAEGLK